MEQVALNTVFAAMMAIFPGFLFRKCFYRGEFTKQFGQSNEFDKLLWNVFFSGVSIGITFLSIYFFRKVSNLEVLNTLSYETVEQIASRISENEVPTKDLMYKTYKDLIFIVFLIYSLACFFGLTLHWLIRTLQLDIKYGLFRFKNYWYYYIHGGKILYGRQANKKLAFTVVDVLCEIAGECRLYKGILSQYTINKDDNNLENIFLTSAKSLKQVKDEYGNTIESKARDIPGAAFCIPYKTVANMNLIYVYEDEQHGSSSRFSKLLIDTLIYLLAVILIVSLWFDLSIFGITGLWNKIGYATSGFVALSNIRLVLSPSRAIEKLSRTILFIASLLWIMQYSNGISFWWSVSFYILGFSIGAFTQSPKENPTNID